MRTLRRWSWLLIALVPACADEPAYPDDCTYDPSFAAARLLDDDTALGYSGATWSRCSTASPPAP
jgi:hypothetical protein